MSEASRLFDAKAFPFNVPVEKWREAAENPAYCDLPREVQEEFQGWVHNWLSFGISIRPNLSSEEEES